MKRYGVSRKILDIEIARRKHLGKEYRFDRRVKTRNQSFHIPGRAIAFAGFKDVGKP